MNLTFGTDGDSLEVFNEDEPICDCNLIEKIRDALNQPRVRELVNELMSED